MRDATLNLTGQVAVVTGAARGIGLECARRFKACGATLVLGDVDARALESASTELDAHAVNCDVQKVDDVTHLAQTAAALGPIGVVMANAGVAAGGPWEQVPLDEWARLLDVNVLGVVRTVQALLPQLIAQRRGHIVITGSSAGLLGNANGMNAPYATSKHALLGLARTLAVYTARHNLHTHLLAPRITDTDFPRNALRWTQSGAQAVGDYDLGDADTAQEVASALIDGMINARFLISLTPNIQTQLHAFADTLEPNPSID